MLEPFDPFALTYSALESKLPGQIHSHEMWRSLRSVRSDAPADLRLLHTQTLSARSIATSSTLARK